MRFAIDVVFVAWPPLPDGSSEVFGVREAVPPLRLATLRGRTGQTATIELAAGRAGPAGLAPAATIRVAQ